VAQIDIDGACPSVLASDGSSVYWATVTDTYANGLGENICMLHIGSAPLGGGSPTVLASVYANEVPAQMLVDGSSLYVATSQSVWRLPTSGGTPVRVAGALNPAPESCLANTEYTAGPTVAMTVDATSLYVASCASCSQSIGAGGVLFKLPK
jgi:hypothetical protein